MFSGLRRFWPLLLTGRLCRLCSLGGVFAGSPDDWEGVETSDLKVRWGVNVAKLLTPKAHRGDIDIKLVDMGMQRTYRRRHPKLRSKRQMAAPDETMLVLLCPSTNSRKGDVYELKCKLLEAAGHGLNVASSCNIITQTVPYSRHILRH